jgi:hypothetical protein
MLSRVIQVRIRMKSVVTETMATGRLRFGKILYGLAWGVAIGLTTWSFYGALLGGGIVVVVGAIAKIFISRGYVPYHATFLGDVAFLAGWLAIILGLFGLFAGASIGARIGRCGHAGEPRGATILRWTQHTLMLTLLTLVTFGKLATTRHIPPDVVSSLNEDLEITAGWTAWGVIFLMITAFLVVPTSVAALYQAREMKAIEAVITKASRGYDTVFLDARYVDEHGAEHQGSFQRDGSPPPQINVGDRVRIQPHRHHGREQIMLPGESPDAMHSPDWGRFFAGVLGFVLLFPFACFFFSRAVFRS